MTEVLLRIDAHLRRFKEWRCERFSHNWFTAPGRRFRICVRCHRREVRA